MPKIDDDESEREMQPNGRNLKIATIVIACIAGVVTLVITSVRFGNDMGEFRTMLRSISAKLDDSVLANGRLATKIEDHESRINQLFTSGSPALRVQMEKIESQLNNDRLEVELLNRVGSPAVQRLSEQLAEVRRLIELHMESAKNQNNKGSQ